MYNRCILIGRLIADPELRTTPNGVNVCSFRIAVDRPFQQNGERKADFINIVAWRGAGEFVSRYFSKGKVIGVEGAIQTRDYTDKEGNKRYAFEVVADRAFFVAPKSSNEVPAAGGEIPAAGGEIPAAGGDEFQPVDWGDTEDTPF